MSNRPRPTQEEGASARIAFAGPALDADVDIDVVIDADATPCAALQANLAPSICIPLPASRGEGANGG